MRTKVKSHKHTFHVLPWTFGPYGRQDVHIHDCDDDCSRVLVGRGRMCDGPEGEHWKATLLDDGSLVQQSRGRERVAVDNPGDADG